MLLACEVAEPRSANDERQLLSSDDHTQHEVSAIA